jgi:hypothetical protein
MIWHTARKQSVPEHWASMLEPAQAPPGAEQQRPSAIKSALACSRASPVLAHASSVPPPLPAASLALMSVGQCRLPLHERSAGEMIAHLVLVADRSQW